MEPTALGWIDYEVSTAPEWDQAQVSRFARHLGYRVVWPDERSVLPVADQARNAGADVVILPAPDHLDPLELNRVMDVADVERCCPIVFRPVARSRVDAVIVLGLVVAIDLPLCVLLWALFWPQR